MEEENLFEFALEKGWDNLLEIARRDHSLASIALKCSMKEKDLSIELNAMRALGLVELVQKVEGGYAYIITGLGLKLLQRRNNA